jgi:hypothetical protein
MDANNGSSIERERLQPRIGGFHFIWKSEFERSAGDGISIVMEGEVDQRQFFLRLLHLGETACAMNADDLFNF